MVCTRLRWAVLLSWAVLAALYPSAGQSQNIGCTNQDSQLCFQGGRFVAEVVWEIPGVRNGRGHSVPLTDDTGTFWFFDNANIELVLKVLDGRPVNGHFWVYYGGLSDVAYTITIADLHTGAREVYRNRPGQLVSRSDTSAFVGEAPGIPTDTTALAASPLLRQGPEFQSNVTFQGEQRDPSVAIGPDGGFLVTWTGPSPGTAESDAFGRFYDAAGQPLTGEVRLNALTEGNEGVVRAAASPTGEYMAVWRDGTSVFGRVFGPGGAPLSGELLIGFDANLRPQGNPWITTDPAGGFLVAWTAAPEVPAGLYSVRWQRFDNRGERVGVELGVDRPLADQARVTALPAGGFVLAWTEGAGAGVFETDILALRLDPQGTPRHSQALRVNTDSFRRPGFHGNVTPVAHPDGGFSFVWSTYVAQGRPGVQGVYARRYGAQGQPVTPVAALRAGISGLEKTAAAALPSGQTLVVWYEYGLIPDPEGGLYGQLFDSSWLPVGGESRLNTYTADLQFEPALAADGDGGIVAAWSSGQEDFGFVTPPGIGYGTQDGHLLGVFGQRFTIASCALDTAAQLCLGGRFRVEARFTDPRTGQPGTAHAIPLPSDTGAFWFFGDTNAELVLKILDGRGVNGHFWIYYGALSDVAYTITITDTLTNQKKTYTNPRGTLASRADTEAF
ncbi:MAG TPA: hypothetical protein VG477_01280 [Thermoanaerobaculia bacterium]|nr:hypothetical protein [Thermoanaerobaculia bacterium]